jgi:HK97 family phage major capsid protein
VVIVDPLEPPHIKRAKQWLEDEREKRDNAPLVYERGGPHSFLRDQINVQLRRDLDGSAKARLEQHEQQVAEHPRFGEVRALNTTQGTGGNAVPPEWMESMFVPLARPGRPTANAAQNFALPPHTNQLMVPKLASGTAVQSQSPQNAAVLETDLTDAAIAAPVVTISGQQSISRQLLDMSAAEFDDILFGDLAAAYAAAIDTQPLTGSGTSGTLTGLTNTSGTWSVPLATNSIQGFYSAVANAMDLILTSRYLPPDIIVMHPRRFGWLCSLLDSTSRPLFLPHIPRPADDAGVLTRVSSENVVAELFGVPIVVDPNVPTNSGGSGDYVFVMRARDLALWESGVQTLVSQQTLAGTMTVVCSLWAYAAFAVRYPTSVALVGPMPAPVLGS